MTPTRQGLNADRSGDRNARWVLPTGTVKGLQRLAKPTHRELPPVEVDA